MNATYAFTDEELVPHTQPTACYAFVDCETTGFAKLRNGVLTFATYITDANYNLLDEYYMEVRPDGSRDVVWTDDAQKVHGITWEKALTFPKIEESVSDLKEFLAKHPPMRFIAHNMAFDRRMVRELFEKTNHLTTEFDKYFPEQECTLKLLKDSGLITGKTRSLGEVCKQLGIDHNHHDAKSDAFVLIEIHKRIYNGKSKGNDAQLAIDEIAMEYEYDNWN
jgi:DNA polymerase III epsilon subunit-like protein